MARDIDFSKPLDEDDIHYLRARTWLVEEAELQGFSIRDTVHNGLSEPAPEGVESDESGDENAEEIDYEEASVAELKAELEKRGLAVSGKKPELIARLEEDDAASDEEEEEE